MSWKKVNQKEMMYASLGLSIAVYIIMFILLKTSYDVFDSDFFYVSIDENDSTHNPVILGIQLTTTSQFVGLCLFFTLNAFLGVWNSVLIDGIFGMMVYDEGEDLIRKLKREYGGEATLLWLFVIYDIWRSARIFFSIIGMYSNVAFFLCTTGGALVAGLVTKKLFLSRENLHLLKVDLTEEEVPIAKSVEESDCDGGIKLQTNLFVIKNK
tara:strand:- start:179 stop:811 length:633 start_codon:yes stop_codon:yes gene_type:complete